jgi:urea transport system permease protein
MREKLGEIPKGALDRVRINNRMRGAIRDALGTLTLRAKDPAKRLAAASTMFSSPDASNIELLDAALAAETDAGVKLAMQQARAASVLNSDAAEADKIAAIELIRPMNNQDALALLGPVAAGEGLARRRCCHPECCREVPSVIYGLSLGSVLCHHLRRHGRHQHGAWRNGHAGCLHDLSWFRSSSASQRRACSTGPAHRVAAGLCVSGLVGIVIERGIIRFLYGRPLETLLATWGISLILQQAVRTIFGPTNREVGNPAGCPDRLRDSAR